MIFTSCDTRVIMFTVLFCKNLNMTNVEVDKETIMWMNKAYLKWLSKNNDLSGYKELEESMSEHIKNCFM